MSLGTPLVHIIRKIALYDHSILQFPSMTVHIFFVIINSNMEINQENIKIVTAFLNDNRLMSLATIPEKAEAPQVTIVYYNYDNNGHLIFATMEDSHKLANIMFNDAVGICISRETSQESLQITATARPVLTQSESVDLLASLYNKISNHDAQTFHWPLLQLHLTNLVIVKATINWFKYEKFTDITTVIEGKGSDLVS